MIDENKVILFPKMLDTLQRESFAAINKQNFKVGLEKLNTLLAYEVFSHEIYVGKIICLIKLEKFDEAEQFCEWLLLDKNDENYYEYIEYFMMVLYELGKYSEIMELVDEEKSTGQIPTAIKKKLIQLYDVCYQMNETVAKDQLNDLKRAINDRNSRLQLYTFNKWQQLRIHPPEIFGAFLNNKDVHPVVKTKILESLRVYQVNHSIKVEKFEKKMIVHPKTLIKLDEHPIYVKTLANIQVVEQHNPTLYQLVKELLDQYSYVCYPFFHPENDVNYVSDALIKLGELNLSLCSSMNNCNKTTAYMDAMQNYHKTYAEIMIQ